MDEQIALLNEDVEQMTTESKSQSKVISEQDRALNTAYYCFGTAKELRDQKILTGGGLFSKSKVLEPGFNKDFFTRIDIREVLEIPLFDKKAKLRSTHPDGSYKFIEDADGNKTLQVTDVKEFWSIGKYLVIEVG